MGTNSGGGADLLLRLDRAAPRPLRAQLEEELRGAIRDGRLAADSRLPPTRSLAADLGVSRRLVVDSYAQLLAEGYLTARAGAGTFVAAGAVSAPAAPAPS
ncbi:MAG TPA: winged helix-turn-helix domain-containing protein, partial [Solirubrobacteraceae bacterium]|nr:winged helix-turn-helix domain-containing protein [Solirubrobacteraceae bacterium]